MLQSELYYKRLNYDSNTLKVMRYCYTRTQKYMEKKTSDNNVFLRTIKISNRTITTKLQQHITPFFPA